MIKVYCGNKYSNKKGIFFKKIKQGKLKSLNQFKKERKKEGMKEKERERRKGRS